MVLQEAAGEPFDGRIAVAGVAFDRIADRRWPDTAHRVIYQPYQFTGMSIPLRKYSQDQITQARIAVEAARAGVRPCGRVLWYHTNYVKPTWDYTKIEIHCQIGAHIFYGDR
jgi:N-acetylmuramoyl-L-alanine amidase